MSTVLLGGTIHDKIGTPFTEPGARLCWRWVTKRLQFPHKMRVGQIMGYFENVSKNNEIKNQNIKKRSIFALQLPQ